MPENFTLAILAAQRTGVVNPLAAKHDVSHKCLVPIGGRPLITHVLDVACYMAEIARIRISIEAEAHDAIAPVIAPYAKLKPIELIASDAGIADSAINALTGQPAPYVITTADNVLVTDAAIRTMATALKDADVALGLATEASIRSAHADAQRNFYTFRDGGYSNCNLYAIRDASAFRAADAFREGGQFMKNPKRLVNAFGLINILMMRAGLLTLAQAFRRVSRRFGLTVAPVVFADGWLAVDVDNERTYDIAAIKLPERMAGRTSPIAA